IQMFLWTEDVDIARARSEGLHPFEDGLSVVKRKDCRRYANVREGHDLRVLPMTFVEVNDKHMIGKVVSKLQVFEVNFTDSRFFRTLQSDAGRNGCHN